ncbi:MAG: aldo/keto reductase [Clostridia bacterium]|nr:aldo/keto reductase [Clostridia bacterium]
MKYMDFQNISLSALGMGCMRLPGDGMGYIDEAQTADMVDFAMKSGINYYDTAWGYHEGNSEIVIGKLLKKYPRDSYYLATKFPGYDLGNMGKVREIFEEQLKKTGVDYFDFYLFHNVCEMNINEYLDSKYGIFDYLFEQKQNGRIRHLGLSVHGSCDVLKRFLDAYGDYMEFCQIQLNWLDWDFQDAKSKVELLNERGIPIWVMEPLRGGKLAKLPDKTESQLRSVRPDDSAPAWAFNFLSAIDGVTVILSGMSDIDQMKENIDIFNNLNPLNDNEMNDIFRIAKEMTGEVPCTSCRYCTEYCPMEINIPGIIRLYNELNYSGGGFLVSMALSAIDEGKRPGDCIGCQSCEAVCPQQIKISEIMSDFAGKLK